MSQLTNRISLNKFTLNGILYSAQIQIIEDVLSRDDALRALRYLSLRLEHLADEIATGELVVVPTGEDR